MAVLEENGNDVEQSVPVLLMISDPDSNETAIPVDNQTSLPTVDDETYARQIAQTMQDEEFARELIEREEALEMERHQRAAASGQVQQIQNASQTKPKKTFGSKLKSFFNPGQKPSVEAVQPVSVQPTQIYQPPPMPYLADDVPLR
jgi:hypothetical protein